MLQNSRLLARNPHVAAVISDSPWKDTLSMWKLREQIKRDESFWGRKPEFLFRTGGWIQNTKESSKQISQNLNTTIFPPMLIGLVILIAALVLLYSWSVLNAEELQGTQTHNLHHQGAESVALSRSDPESFHKAAGHQSTLQWKRLNRRPACVFYSVDLKNSCLYYHFAELLLWFGLILCNRLRPGVIFHAFPTRLSIFYCNMKRCRIPGIRVHLTAAVLAAAFQQLLTDQMHWKLYAGVDSPCLLAALRWLIYQSDRCQEQHKLAFFQPLAANWAGEIKWGNGTGAHTRRQYCSLDF